MESKSATEPETFRITPGQEKTLNRASRYSEEYWKDAGFPFSKEEPMFISAEQIIAAYEAGLLSKKEARKLLKV